MFPQASSFPSYTKSADFDLIGQYLILSQPHLPLKGKPDQPIVCQSIPQSRFLNERHQNSSKQHHNEESQPKNCKNGTSEMKNLPKYIIKLFQSQFHKIRNQLINRGQKQEQIRQRLLTLNKFLTQTDLITQFGLKHLQMLISGNLKPQLKQSQELQNKVSSPHSNYSLYVRSTLKAIVQKDLKKHWVMRSKKISQKLTYLNGLKIFKLRCMSSTTACRMASK